MGYVILKGESMFSSPDTIVVDLDALTSNDEEELCCLIDNATAARLFNIADEARAKLDELT